MNASTRYHSCSSPFTTRLTTYAQVLLIHDPTDAGAHEDWSRLARLSFDGLLEEMECSQHAIELLDLIEEVALTHVVSLLRVVSATTFLCTNGLHKVRAMNTGAPVVPVKPGMLFVASPGHCPPPRAAIAMAWHS